MAGKDLAVQRKPAPARGTRSSACCSRTAQSSARDSEPRLRGVVPGCELYFSLTLLVTTPLYKIFVYSGVGSKPLNAYGLVLYPVPPFLTRLLDRIERLLFA